jgi:hypothetical protein
MSITYNELWTVLHGLVFGSIYLLAFAGGFEAFWGIGKGEILTDSGMSRRLKRLNWGTIGMAVISWITVISGTYIVYPWYRAKVPTSPRSLLLANPEKAEWHNFAMEWKEHIAWFVPILATVVAVLVVLYGKDFVKRNDLRKVAFAIFIIAFMCAAIAGLWGAFINKAAPVL